MTDHPSVNLPQASKDLAELAPTARYALCILFDRNVPFLLPLYRLDAPWLPIGHPVIEHTLWQDVDRYIRGAKQSGSSTSSFR